MPTMPPRSNWDYVPPGTTVNGDKAWTDVDEVRYWLQDTNSEVRLQGDLELQWLIDEWMPKYDSLVYVAAVAADRISAQFAGVVSVSADGVSVNVADISERYHQLAERLRQLHKDHQVGGEVDISNLLWDQYEDWTIAPLVFGVGMDDNPQAGRQNYGSGRGNAYPERDTVGWF